jgi:hypothetical protein
MSAPPTGVRRLHRSQKFVLSAEGRDAEDSYRSGIRASRHEAGRASYDAARASWAASYGLQPDDALYLGEVREGTVTLADMVESLDSCGKTHRDALAALGRLLDRGLLVVEAAR